MFREMRKHKRQLPQEEIPAILERASNGVLACCGDDGCPYAVPLNYVYMDGKICFHSAKEGHKIDALARQPKVSFAVVGEDTIVSAEYTSYFRSVIAFGKARIAEGEERIKALEALVEKYSSDQPEASKRETIDRCTMAHVVVIDVEHLTGKEAKEYAEQRKAK